MVMVLRAVVILFISVIVLILLSNNSQATVNTLRLVESYPTGSDTVCVFSDGRRTETWVRDGAGGCPTHMTFGSDEDEE